MGDISQSDSRIFRGAGRDAILVKLTRSGASRRLRNCRWSVMPLPASGLLLLAASAQKRISAHRNWVYRKRVAWQTTYPR